LLNYIGYIGNSDIQWGGWGRGERDQRVASHDNADSDSDGLRVLVEERPSDSSGLQGWFEVRVPSAAGKTFF